jgi:ribosome biogenesis GTPase A
MGIQWVPGHMATARREIRRVMPEVHVVIEVIDARIPFSSENPLVAELRGQKPCVQVLNKADLADPAVTEAWLTRIRARPGMRALAHHAGQRGLRAELFRLVATFDPPPRARPLVAMILGVPNVGKSTILNTLAGRTLAKAQDRPAVTQRQQRVNVGLELTIVDTPGFLWPKLSPESCAYRLAVTGAIADRVVDYPELAVFALRFLATHYGAPVAAHYGLDTLPVDPLVALDAIARRRGHIGRGGVVDYARVSETVIRELRAGALGPLSLEFPP